MSRRRLRADMDEFAKVYNAAWSTNWGFVPYSAKDLDDLATTYQLVYDRDWFMVAEIEGETVAAAITVPDVNQVLKRMKGRVLPFGWWHYLRRHRIINGVRVGFLGVLPEHQHTGAAALLYMEHYDMAGKPPPKWGEAGWILENNSAMNRGLEAMGGKIVKRYRVYERLLEGARRGLVEIRRNRRRFSTSLAYGSISTPGFRAPVGSSAALAPAERLGERLRALAVVPRTVVAADRVVVGDRAAAREHRLRRRAP